MATLSIPYSFSPTTEAFSAQVNANFQAVQTAVNSIDNTNIGTAGLYASQLIPTTAAQATFGGSLGYAFPASVQASSNASTKAYVPPVYTSAGAATASTEHIVRGSASASFGNYTAGTVYTASLSLSGAAQFSNAAFVAASGIQSNYYFYVLNAYYSFLSNIVYVTFSPQQSYTAVTPTFAVIVIGD